jgi:hypothetical protein
MERLFRNLGALAIGTVSFVATVGLVLGIQKLIGLNLFSLMWWGVIPAGAFLCGLLAASGYYGGAVALHVKPARFMAIAMLVLAALVQVALYYSQYALAETESGQAIRELVSFPRFVGWSLSHTRYGIIVHGYRPGGEGGGLEIGALGYVVAVVQFIALSIGGLGVWAILADKPYCDDCTRYLKRVVQLQLPYGGDLSALDPVRAVEAGSSAYFDRLHQLPAGNQAALELDLSRCAGCGKQALMERPMLAKEGKLAYHGGSNRTTWHATGGASLAESLQELRSPAPPARASGQA